MIKFLKNFWGDKEIKRYSRKVEEVNAFEPKLKELKNEELLEKSKGLREKVKNGMPEDEVLTEAFALVREASRRTLGQRHFDVQLIGGMVLHEGKITEMLTGEGKTLAATAPAYLNALSGKGVHIVTVNDYLAKRDTIWMGQIYNALGLKVTCLVHDAAYQYDPEHTKGKDEERDTLGGFKVFEEFLRPISRGEAYQADILYGTNHEFGFDYLRDNLTYDLNQIVQARRTNAEQTQNSAENFQRDSASSPRDSAIESTSLNFAIIDEVDSILIDEARTPLIIAAPDSQSSEFYKIFAKVTDRLEPETDYTVDEKNRSVSINNQGIEKVEKMINLSNLYAPENLRLVHFLEESLKAKALFHRDKQYVVRNGEVIIVDEFTGRMLFGRRYSGGLHQAVEAKEGVQVKDENRTYAQITIQNYFRLYKKIAGMTGTAQTSAEEFHKVYNLDVASTPPNKPMIRMDLPDAIYKTKAAKYEAVVEEVKRRREKGQPILLGTTSITNNEIISEYLRKAGIPHEVLNAKNHEREGEIIAQAGKVGAVTVATNMAGRGVDIVFGGNPPDADEAQKVREAGGLHVIGTERHEARRIDNQLRGRSGRQGDPGSSQFFLSLEDDLLRIFGGERIKNLMEIFNMPDDVPIESSLVSKAVNEAQQKIEGINFDLRRHLLDFDDVLNKQRTVVYKKRLEVLEAGEKNEIRPIVEDILKNHGKDLSKLPGKLELERSILIGQQLVRILDMFWVGHLENLEALRESVNIRAYAQHEPIVEYRREAHMLYKKLNEDYEAMAVETIMPLFEIDLTKLHTEHVHRQTPPPEAKKLGRNDPCWCGAKYEDGRPKKYKHCHGR
jgi:preprotein translocase subunit SecA